MAIVIRNLTGGDGICEYEVRVNDARAIAHFSHNRKNGLAACLEAAAKAVRKADDDYLVTIYERMDDASTKPPSK